MLYKRATSVAHLTNFSFEFFDAVFTEDASLLFYTMVRESKTTTNSSQGGPALTHIKVHPDTTRMTWARYMTLCWLPVKLDQKLRANSNYITKTTRKSLTSTMLILHCLGQRNRRNPDIAGTAWVPPPRQWARWERPRKRASWACGFLAQSRTWKKNKWARVLKTALGTFALKNWADRWSKRRMILADFAVFPARITWPIPRTEVVDQIFFRCSSSRLKERALPSHMLVLAYSCWLKQMCRSKAHPWRDHSF